jgi:CDP-glucose 4,6-dehydratase
VGVGLPGDRRPRRPRPLLRQQGLHRAGRASYRHAFLAGQGVALATARAGNVIGGGDWTASRLVPDVLAAFAAGEPCTAQPRRHPPLAACARAPGGLPALAQRLATEIDTGQLGRRLELRPRRPRRRSVAWVVERLAEGWGPDARWSASTDAQVHEAHTLKLDCSKARAAWAGAPAGTPKAIASLAWHQAWRGGADMRRYTLDEITAFARHP